MALICNGYRFGHMPHAVRTGALTTIYNGRGFRDMVITGMLRNITAGEGITSEKVGVPMGYLHPGSWIMPQKPGNLSSHNNARGEASCAATAFWTMSGTSAGTSTSTLSGYTVAQASGLIEGECTITGALGGTAWCAGQADGIATATMNSYATGALSGHIYVNTGTAEVEQLVDGVWNAMTTEYQEVGSTGKALTSAGSAGDPWSGIMAGYTDDATFGAFMKKLMTTGKFIALK